VKDIEMVFECKDIETAYIMACKRIDNEYSNLTLFERVFYKTDDNHYKCVITPIEWKL
jgi:hypothetical protein